MLKKLVFAGMILILMVSFAVVFADQDGNARWCNSDQYGCWVTGDDGEQIYIMFWSESARKLFMGDSTAPYTNVVDRCVDCGAKMTLESVKLQTRKTMGKPSAEDIQRIAEEISAQEGKEYVCEWLEATQTVSCRSAEDAEKFPYCTPDGSSCFSTQEALNEFEGKSGAPEVENSLETIYPYCTSDGSSCFDTNEALNAFEGYNNTEYRSPNGKTIEEMKDWLWNLNIRTESFLEFFNTATDSQIIYNYRYLGLGKK